MRLATQIEAILYIKGQPLSLEEIATYLDGGAAAPATQARTLVEDALIELMNDYAHRDSALEIVETPTGYSLQLKTTYESLVQQLVPAEISTGTLRTLAAIALKNPILQTNLIELRGSSAYQQVAELVQMGFIRKRPQTDGRSYWLEVTDKFHQYFEIEEVRAGEAIVRRSTNAKIAAESRSNEQINED